MPDNNRHLGYLQELPSDWPRMPIEKLGNIFGGGTPGRNEPSFWGGSIAWLTPGELLEAEWKCITKTREYITDLGLANSSAKLLPPGTVLVTTRATIGSVAVAGIQLCTNQGFKNIILHELNDSFFYYYLLSLLAPEMRRLASGSTFDEISRRDFASIIVPRPIHYEQRQVATILDTLDTQIQHTQQLISKLKRQREGMLHDLLTRGLDENGQLRDPEAHPELFKDSVLGRIPKEWEVKLLKDIYAIPARNGLYKAPRYYGKGTLMIHMPQMFRGLTIDASDAARVQVTSAEYKRFSLAVGDLMFARRSLNFDGAGKCSLISELSEDTTFESSIIRVRLLGDRVRPDFVNYFLNSNIGTRLRNPLIRQVAVSGVSSEDIGTIPIPLLTRKEQDMIVDFVHLYDRNTQTEEANLAKLKLYKQGLMHDLLTGRVRVGIGSEENGSPSF
jgi:type I restriction enzyme S subunit